MRGVFDESSPHRLFVHKAFHNHRPRIRDLPLRHQGLSLVPADQGGVLVVPPAHRASGTRRVARGQRRHGRTNRGALPGSLGAQPAGRMADDRNPDATRHRHRLERIPHPNRIPRRSRLPTTGHTIWPITRISTSVTLHLLKQFIQLSLALTQVLKARF